MNLSGLPQLERPGGQSFSVSCQMLATWPEIEYVPSWFDRPFANPNTGLERYRRQRRLVYEQLDRDECDIMLIRTFCRI